jgi:predicted RNA-binding protein with TRAM domain
MDLLVFLADVGSRTILSSAGETVRMVAGMIIFLAKAKKNHTPKDKITNVYNCNTKPSYNPF